MFSCQPIAAVSCSPVTPRLGAGGIWVGFDGQVGPCMGRCMGGVLFGAWVVYEWLSGLVRLDLGIGGGLDGDGEEVVGVVSCEMENIFKEIRGRLML